MLNKIKMAQPNIDMGQTYLGSGQYWRLILLKFRSFTTQYQQYMLDEN